MGESKKTLYFVSLFLIFSVVCIGTSVSLGSAKEIRKWAFDFKNCTVSDALNQISKETNIQIYFNKDLNNKFISKSYRDSSIEEIITDIFRKENFAIVWNYSESRLDIVEISTVEGGAGGGGFKSSKAFNSERINLKNDNTRKNDHKSTLAQSNHQKSNITNSSLQSKSGSYLKESKAMVPSEDSKPGAFRTRTILFRSGNNTSNRGIEETTDDEGIYVSPPPSIPEDENNKEQDLTLDTPPPVPDKWHGLEPPPMPPGFTSVK